MEQVAINTDPEGRPMGVRSHDDGHVDRGHDWHHGHHVVTTAKTIVLLRLRTRLGRPGARMVHSRGVLSTEAWEGKIARCPQQQCDYGHTRHET